MNVSTSSTVSLRAATAADREFLYSVYASTREEELAVTEWPAEAIAAFLRSQFEAQDAHYRQHYTGAKFLVIEDEREAAGRLYVMEGERDIRIMDIALLPKFRGRGIATQLLERILEQARTSGCTASIHVEKNNRARHLYERFGFVVEEDRGVYDFLVWRGGDVS